MARALRAGGAAGGACAAHGGARGWHSAGLRRLGLCRPTPARRGDGATRALQRGEEAFGAREHARTASAQSRRRRRPERTRARPHLARRGPRARPARTRWRQLSPDVGGNAAASDSTGACGASAHRRNPNGDNWSSSPKDGDGCSSAGEERHPTRCKCTRLRHAGGASRRATCHD